MRVYILQNDDLKEQFISDGVNPIPPPHNKNVLGQNFSFVVAQGGATFSGKFRSFNKNVHFNKKVL